MFVLGPCSPPANATPEQDRQFSELLWQHGIEPGHRAVESAQAVCEYVWLRGFTPAGVAVMVDDQNDGLDYDASKNFVAISIVVYCAPFDDGSIYA